MTVLWLLLGIVIGIILREILYAWERKQAMRDMLEQQEAILWEEWDEFERLLDERDVT